MVGWDVLPRNPYAGVGKWLVSIAREFDNFWIFWHYWLDPRLVYEKQQILMKNGETKNCRFKFSRKNPREMWFWREIRYKPLKQINCSFDSLRGLFFDARTTVRNNDTGSASTLGQLFKVILICKIYVVKLGKHYIPNSEKSLLFGLSTIFGLLKIYIKLFQEKTVRSDHPFELRRKPCIRVLEEVFQQETTINFGVTTEKLKFK